MNILHKTGNDVASIHSVNSDSQCQQLLNPIMLPVVPAVRQRERLSKGQNRAPAQEASRLSQWAAGPWTVVQSTCQIPPHTTWISACLSVDKRETRAKLLKVSESESVSAVVCRT